MHSEIMLGEDFEKEDFEFFKYNFTGPHGEKYKKCYCGKYFEDKGEYCNDACKLRKPKSYSWWLSEGKVWRRTEKGIEEVVDTRIPSQL